MTGPSDESLVRVVGDATGEEVTLLWRRPYEYATSAALEEVAVAIGGRERTLIVKHLDRDDLIGDARTSKPVWLHQPSRELGAYRALDGCDVTPRFYGGTSDDEAWMVIDKVDGVELWQIGDTEVWRAVAAWLARFHDRFASSVETLRVGNPHLVVYDGPWVASWIRRSVEAVARAGDSRAATLQMVLGRASAIVAEWDSFPVRFVHGELYPSNVLVGPGSSPTVTTLDVRPVDWEMSGLGPAALDVAALSAGWDHDERNALIAAYTDASREPHDIRRAVDLARLHLALRWLGWAEEWNAPAEHASDWVAEALSAAADLGVL